VEAGGKKFLFDAGRGAMQRLFQLKVPFSEIDGLFLTHLHSDHVIGIPDLWLTGWLGQAWGGRDVPLGVRGPTGTRQMMSHLEQAFQFDIQIRTHYSKDGVGVVADDFTGGVVYDEDGLRITAFEVDHGRVKPAFGYRIDFDGRSAVLSGDTCLNENVISFAQGVDLLVHEVAGTSAELLQTSNTARIVAGNHTSPEEAAEVFSRAKPKLAVYSHILQFGGVLLDDMVDSTRRGYSGPFEVGEDLMSIDVGSTVAVRRFEA
jgi:ribonuclease Z